jgi:putative tryptophan/tyrosine transport system substrate-binding protein
MRRREFIGVLSGAAAWPLGACTQPATSVIGFLHSASPDPFTRLVAAFKEGLSEGPAGYVEGRNVKIEYRWAEGQEDRLAMLAADLVNRPVALIAALGGMRSALAAKAATPTIPILFIAGSDPIEAGLVSSLARPGGNATGVSNQTTEMIAKRLQVLRDLLGSALPSDAKLGMLVTTAPAVEKVEVEFAERNGLVVLKPGAGKEFNQTEYADKFDTAVKTGVRALLVSADPFFTNWRSQIVALAAKYALPVVYPLRQYVVAGGLASYGPDIAEEYRLIGRYAARILKGQKPADLPVQQPRKFESVINLTTAKALGLTLPGIILAGSELIE